MNNQLIIDMIKTLASHLGTYRERREVYDQLVSILPQSAWRYDLEEHVEIVRSSGNYRVFAVKDADDTLASHIDGYYFFKHQENDGHLCDMAHMLWECEFMHNAPMEDRMAAFNLSPDDTKLHDCIAEGHMVLPKLDRYLEDPTGSDEWERDFRDALDHFWSGQGSEYHSEKVKFVMNWLADQV